ncbi:MAG TPA: hypothetical protein VKY92_23590 [Verrucomicrobiae bacterium]|nr:hypothetical protein [Verrucomicrobiae bacterium]
MNTPEATPGRRTYIWPWAVLAAFVAAVLLAILWLSFEIRRTQRIRDANQTPVPGTNQPVQR